MLNNRASVGNAVTFKNAMIPHLKCPFSMTDRELEKPQSSVLIEQGWIYCVDALAHPESCSPLTYSRALFQKATRTAAGFWPPLNCGERTSSRWQTSAG
jgi:hypothetical protein